MNKRIGNMVQKIAHTFGYHVTTLSSQMELTEKLELVSKQQKSIDVMQRPPMAPELFKVLADSYDYVRYGSIGLAIHRILTDHIEGDFAEAGVYKGQTSRIIHIMAPSKKLYLFDTFSGFPSEEPIPWMDVMFKDTSVEEVLATIGDTNNIIVRQGYFPDTAKGLDNEQFSFVLLDMDKYAPTLAGLRFFYPRVVPGGFIFIHDYNNRFDNQRLKATSEFLNGKPEQLIELPDVWGTAVLRKL